MSETILVTDGGDRGARSTLAAVRALAAAGYRAMVTIDRQLSLAACSRYCSEYVITPNADDPRFAESVRDAARLHDAAGILPASDAVLAVLGAPVQELINKTSLAKRAARVGFAVPATQRIESEESLRAWAEEFPYPIVLKPEVSQSPAVRLSTPREVFEFRLNGPAVVQPYLEGPMEATAGMIRDGRLVAVVHQRYLRTWPMDCGTSCAAITVEGDTAREEKLLELFAEYEGIFQVQFRDGHLLDVNPRVYGSLPLAVAAGANLAALQADLLLGKPAPQRLLRGRHGVRYRWIDGDLRHAASLVMSGRLRSALSAVLPHRGTVHSIWSWRDPVPSLLRAKLLLEKLR